jgi:lipase
MIGNEPILKSVDIGDASLQYLWYEGNGPTLIFLHSTGFLPWLWHPIARTLTDSFKIISPYFCDHRSADPENGGLDWLLLAEDFTKFCECLEINSPLMIGHSMGGAIMTIAGGHFGLSIEKLMLIEPIFLPREVYTIPMTVDQHPLAGKSIKRKNDWQDVSEAMTYLKSKPLFQAWNDEMLDLYVQYGMAPSENGGLELACHPRKEAALFMGSLGYDPWPIISNVKCPVLVVEGENSSNRGFIDLKKAADIFPNGQYRLIKDVGHLIPMEKPETITRITREFFS